MCLQKVKKNSSMCVFVNVCLCVCMRVYICDVVVSVFISGCVKDMGVPEELRALFLFHCHCDPPSQHAAQRCPALTPSPLLFIVTAVFFCYTDTDGAVLVTGSPRTPAPAIRLKASFIPLLRVCLALSLMNWQPPPVLTFPLTLLAYHCTASSLLGMYVFKMLSL